MTKRGWEPRIFVSKPQRRPGRCRSKQLGLGVLVVEATCFKKVGYTTIERRRGKKLFWAKNSAGI